MDRAALTALNRAGDTAYQAVEKVNAELLTLTYGALVAQLCEDLEDVAAVNAQLDVLGYNLGLRLADDFLARMRMRRCRTFGETAETVARVGFRVYLGVVRLDLSCSVLCVCVCVFVDADLCVYVCVCVCVLLSLSVSPSLSSPRPQRWATGRRTGGRFRSRCVFLLNLVLSCGADSLQLEDNPLQDFVELPPSKKGLLYGNLICGVLRGCLEMVQYRVDVRYVQSVLHGDRTDKISVALVEVIQDEIPPGDQ